jgi:hypothetical protein
VGWLRDWAEFLAKSADVHFSTEVADGATVCELLYAGDEAPRFFATKLLIATGEVFEAEEVRPETDVQKTQAAPPISDEVTEVDRSGQVSLMITRAQRRDLRRLGYSDEHIRTMTPAEAHRNLGLVDKVAP